MLLRYRTEIQDRSPVVVGTLELNLKILILSLNCHRDDDVEKEKNKGRRTQGAKTPGTKD